MMPQLLTVRVTRPQHRSVRIWVPVLPAVLLLAPLLILAGLAAAVACLMYRVSVGPAFGNGWRLFCALPGTRIDIREGPTTVLVSIR
jgi:hypothetical protein